MTEGSVSHGPLKLPEDQVVIRYGVERAEHGWWPVMLRSWETYWPSRRVTGYDRDVALQLAVERAEEERSHYAGDWTIELREVEF